MVYLTRPLPSLSSPYRSFPLPSKRSFELPDLEHQHKEMELTEHPEKVEPEEKVTDEEKLEERKVPMTSSLDSQELLDPHQLLKLLFIGERFSKSWEGREEDSGNLFCGL